MRRHEANTLVGVYDRLGRIMEGERDEARREEIDDVRGDVRHLIESCMVGDADRRPDVTYRDGRVG